MVSQMCEKEISLHGVVFSVVCKLTMYLTHSMMVVASEFVVIIGSAVWKQLALSSLSNSCSEVSS